MAIAIAAISGEAHDQAEERQRAVDEVLDELAPAAELRRLHMDQRQPGDRPGVDPRTRHVGQRRRQHQVDAGALELPAQAPQAGRGELAGRRHRDGVDAGRLGRLEDRAERADHRHVAEALRHRCEQAVRDAGAHDVVPGVRLAAQRAHELGDVRRVPHHQHLTRPGAVALARLVQPLARGEAAHHQAGEAHPERQRQEPARHAQVDHVAEDRDRARQPKCGGRHTSILFRTVADQPIVVSTMQLQRHQPNGREAEDHDGVRDRAVGVPFEQARVESEVVAGGHGGRDDHGVDYEDCPDICALVSAHEGLRYSPWRGF